MNKIESGTLVLIKHPSLSSYLYNGREGTIISLVGSDHDNLNYYNVVVHSGNSGVSHDQLMLLPQTHFAPAKPVFEPIIREDFHTTPLFACDLTTPSLFTIPLLA